MNIWVKSNFVLPSLCLLWFSKMKRKVMRFRWLLMLLILNFMSCGAVDNIWMTTVLGSWVACCLHETRQLPLHVRCFNMAPKKEISAASLDQSRAVEADPRDPRSSEKEWPCYGNHIPGNAKGNKWASWTHCSRCNLRLSYIPKVGAPASDAACPNPGNVRLALTQLRAELGPDMEPNADLMKVMVDKVIAEERMKTLLNEYKDQVKKAAMKIAKASKALEKPMTGQKSSGYGASNVPEPNPMTPRSTTSWEAVSPDRNLMQFLTDAERAEVHRRVAERMAEAQRTQVEQETGMEFLPEMMQDQHAQQWRTRRMWLWMRRWSLIHFLFGLVVLWWKLFIAFRKIWMQIWRQRFMIPSRWLGSSSVRQSRNCLHNVIAMASRLFVSTCRTAMIFIALRPMLAWRSSLSSNVPKDFGYRLDVLTTVAGWISTIVIDFLYLKESVARKGRCFDFWRSSYYGSWSSIPTWRFAGSGLNDVVVGKNLLFSVSLKLFALWIEIPGFVVWMAVASVWSRRMGISFWNLGTSSLRTSTSTESFVYEFVSRITSMSGYTE